MMIFFVLFISQALAFFSSDPASRVFCGSVFTGSGCDTMWKSNRTGGSFPLMFDAFSLLPSSLPTYSTPFGFEVFNQGSKMNFATIKGFSHFGTGISVRESDFTFFSPVSNEKVALKSALPSYQDKSVDHFSNYGVTINVIDIKDWFSLPMGIATRYNSERKTWTTIPSISFVTKYVNAGFSRSKEKSSTVKSEFYDTDEEFTTTTSTAGIRIGSLVVDYTRIILKTENIVTMEDQKPETTYSNVATDIVSAHLYYAGMTLSWGIRKQQRTGDLISEEEKLIKKHNLQVEHAHTLLGVQFKIGQKVNMGIFKNYVLTDAINVMAQIML